MSQTAAQSEQNRFVLGIGLALVVNAAGVGSRLAF